MPTPSIDPIPGALSAVQAGLGVYQTIAGSIKMNKARKRMTPYKTPDEIFRMQNLAFSNAQGDTINRDFQTGQLNRATSQVAGTAMRMGADPNMLSSLLEQQIQGTLKIGNEYHASNMEGFSKVMQALNLVSENRTAEWQSQQNMLKDQAQSAASTMQSGLQNIGGGINTYIAGDSAAKTKALYGIQPQAAASNYSYQAPANPTVQNPMAASNSQANLLNMLKAFGNPAPVYTPQPYQPNVSLLRP